MGKEGQVAKVEKEEQVATRGAIGKTSTPVQPGTTATTTTTGRPSAPADSQAASTRANCLKAISTLTE